MYNTIALSKHIVSSKAAICKWNTRFLLAVIFIHFFKEDDTMLFTCPECSNKISDKASTCPHCGCPKSFFRINATAATPAPKAPTKRKHKKLPNGYGYIQYFSDKRRLPFIVYAPISKHDYDDNGNPGKRQRLGSFKTYNEAYNCLSIWHRTHGFKNDDCPIFSEVYAKMMDELENDSSEKKLSDSTLSGFRSAYKWCSDLYNMSMSRIYKAEIENVLEKCDKGYSTVMGIKKLINKIFKYSVENGIIEKDYSKFAHVKKLDDTEKGEPFTEEQLKILWQNDTDPDVQITLILIYTGLRISELKKTTIDTEQQIMQGGIKTPAGMNRTIPWHKDIIKFIEAFDQESFSPDYWRSKNFYPLMNRLNIPTADSGAKHTPHDCRHTFSWLCDSCKVDKFSKYLMIGHDMSDDVDQGTYGHRTLKQLRAEINKLVIYK